MNISAASKASNPAVRTIHYHEPMGPVELARLANGCRDCSAAREQEPVFVRRARYFGFNVDESVQMQNMLQEIVVACADRHRQGINV